MRVELQPAFILHTRPYRNTSVLVDFLTPEYGRVTAVARGIRSGAKSARQRRAVFQPFTPLLVGWGGKAELKSLNHFEGEEAAYFLTGKSLFSALYLNELLCRLVRQQEENSQLFALYRLTLKTLQLDQDIDIVLRRFELELLALLGYGIELAVDAETGLAVEVGRDYRFFADRGFCATAPGVTERSARDLFLGDDLLALSQGDYTPEVRRSAKRLCRQALHFHLGGKPLKSRELFG
ncbi:DNA repair protein RecO [Deltaproteobacteria bacterium]|nr:DNA repair protein RecO [Deltaproteobacteria bacterium]